jgi:hypothetical protein
MVTNPFKTNHKSLKAPYLIFLIFLFVSTLPKAQPSGFEKVITEPLHQKPNFFPKSYDHLGYNSLLDSLIQWEMTRSMYDYKFGSALGQIKILSNITQSDYGIAMYHYLEGVRHDLGDPLNGENHFLKALEYFESQKDTSAILHTTMHMFRLSLNTTMLEIGNLSRYYLLYTQVLAMGENVKTPLDKIVHLRNKILYDEYFCGEKKLDYYLSDINAGLSVIESLDTTYDYYRFLMLNTIGIIYSKNIKYEQSEQWHLKAYDAIKKYPSRELNMAEYRIAAMKYENGKYQESLDYLKITTETNRNNKLPKTYIHNFESYAFMFKLFALNYHKLGDIAKEEEFTEKAYFYFVDIFTKRRHKLYMIDMAALHKNEENAKTIIDSKNKESSLYLWLSVVFVLFFSALIFVIFRTAANKNLKKEIQRRDAIYLLIGHDLSSPIIAMGDILSQIETNLDPVLSPTQKSYLYMLKTKIQGAYLLLLNLLQWYKTEIQHEIGNTPSKIANIKKNIDISVEHLFFNTAKHDITFKNMCSETFQIPLNEEKFQTIVRNLVDNAIKHASCKNILVNATLKATSLVITVEDDGIGISKENADIINNPNNMINFKNSKAKIGLGTIFILEFVEKMNSKINVETHPNGTKFTWEIPVVH